MKEPWFARFDRHSATVPLYKVPPQSYAWHQPERGDEDDEPEPSPTTEPEQSGWPFASLRGLFERFGL